jgi:hypothetical protein
LRVVFVRHSKIYDITLVRKLTISVMYMLAVKRVELPSESVQNVLDNKVQSALNVVEGGLDMDALLDALSCGDLTRERHSVMQSVSRLIDQGCVLQSSGLYHAKRQLTYV